MLLGLVALLWIVVRRMRDWWRARSDTIADSAAPSPGDPRLVVTLVHGTWGRKAEWTRHSSPLCRSLLSQAPGQVYLAPFPWSGRNTSRARIAAAERLRYHIISLIERYPAAAHFVVAHSHGGNIALYSAQDERVRAGLAGIACLSTPFLHVRRRALGPISGGQLFAAMGIGLLYLFAALLQALGIGEDAAVLWSIGMAVCVTWPLARVSRSASDRMLNSLRLPNEPPTATLIVRAMGDEASGGPGRRQRLHDSRKRLWSRAWRAMGTAPVCRRRWVGSGRRSVPGSVVAWCRGGSVRLDSEVLVDWPASDSACYPRSDSGPAIRR